MTATRTDRRAIGAVAMQFLLNGITSSSFVARLPELRDRVGITVGTLGALLTLAGVFGLIGSALAGRLVERWGTRQILIVGVSSMIVALPLIGASTSVPMLIAALGVFVFADILVDISMNLQGSWLSGRRSVPVMNRLHGLWSLGSVTGGLAAVGAAAAGLVLWRHLLIVSVVCAVLMAVIANGLLRSDEDPRTGQIEFTREVPVRGAYLALALAGVFAIVMEQTSSDWAAFRMVDDFGTSPALAGVAFVAFTAGMTIGRFAGDSLSVRWGGVLLHRVATAFAGAGLLLATLTQVRALVIVGFLAAGLGIATFLPKLYDDAAKAPGRRGAGLGAMTAGTRLAGLVTPSMVGVLAATDLSIGSAMAIVTLPAVALYAATVAWVHHGERMRAC